MISVKDMNNLIVPEEFGIDEDDYSNASFDYIIDKVGEDSYAYGASKFVIFPEEKDIVIKLPLNGQFYWDDEDEDYTYFVPLQNINYCAEEENMYFYAVEEGVDMFFAATECGGFTKTGVPYYISTRVATYTKNESTPSEASQKSAGELRHQYGVSVPSYWLAQAIEYYGNELVCKLLHFIDEHKINDIHSENVGYRIQNGAPCIFDYSGYHS